MKKLSKIFIMIGGLFLISSQAYAVKCYIVWDPDRFKQLNRNNTLLGDIVKNTALEASNNTNISSNLLLLSNYIKGGPADIGNGVISQLVAANLKLANIISSNKELDKMKNENLDNSNTKERVKDMLLKTLPNRTACENMSLGSYNSGLSSKSKNIAVNTEKETMNFIDTTDEVLKNLEQKVATKNTFDVCTEEDFKNKRAGCEKVGKYPAADKRASSITSPVLSKEELASGKLSNDTFTSEQYNVAMKTVTNMFSTVPVSEVQDKNQTNSTSGLNYSVERDAYITRLSSGVNFATKLMASRAGGDIMVNSSDVNVGVKTILSQIGHDAWMKNEAKWKELNPNKNFPKYPSIVEFQKYEIDRRYTDMGEDSWQEELNNQTQIEATREQALMMAMKLNQLYRMIESEDHKTLMLSSLLVNDLDPTNKAKLDSLKSGVLAGIASNND